MKKRLAGAMGVLAFSLAGEAAEERKTVSVVAGPRYKANAVHRLVFGAGYRKLWTTPIEVEVLDLGAFSGGLTPEKRTGGKQTKGLRLKGGDGREWKFRSVDKDPSPVVPKALRRSPVDDIVQDQISASLPANGLVVDALSDAAGILHVDRHLFVMPDDPRLGEFRKDFAGLLGTLEEVPRVEPPVTPGFEGFGKVAEADELEKAVDADPRERVDSRAFLRARLFDALIGDYDRHHDQWDWAREAGAGRWVPVPKDRDLAFVKFDGLALDLVRLTQPRLVDYEEEYPRPLALVWQARFIDRRYLSDLEWPAWQETSAELQARLTDRVIDDAVKRLPPPYYRLEGPTLAAQLKARREGLREYARRYYELLAGEPEIHATDEAETAQLLRLGDGSEQVVLAGPNGPYFRRTFRSSETQEVRVFLKGGDDRALSEGRGKPGVKVRLVGGEGNDFLDDSAGGYTTFYDSSGENRVVEGPGTRKDTRPYTPAADGGDKPARDWGGALRVLPWIRGGGGYGLVLGASLERLDYGFRKHPYSHRHSLRIGYSTIRQTGGVHYDYESLRTDNRSRLQVAARASRLEVIHFYGFGNETNRFAPRTFHDVELTRLVLAPSYRLDLPGIDISLGPVVKYSDSRLPASSLIAFERPYGADPFGQAGGRLGIKLDRRDDPAASTKGVLLSAEGAVYPRVWDAQEAFGEVHGEAALMVPIGSMPTLALRAAGQRVFGRYPYHEAAYIGGSETVRGLPRQRYGGDASLYGNAELRFPLRRKPGSMVPGFGVFGLADAGRVFLTGESSDRWHTALGGGLWLSVVDHTMSLSVARSEGHVRVYLQGGLLF